MAKTKKYKDRKEYLLQYYQDNKEREQERRRMWARKWRKENPELAREKDKEKREKSLERRREYAREYARNNPKDPLKVAARTILNNAVKLGDVSKSLVCETCLHDRPLQGHHEDYQKPLEVKWLCAKCHALEHHPLP